MGILNVFKKDKKEEGKKSHGKIAKGSKSTKKVTKVVKNRKVSLSSLDLIREPRLTEKATDLGVLNKYVFNVLPRANKKEIKRAIEEIFTVTVTKVNILNLKGKDRTVGRFTGKRSKGRKAVVTLKEGDKIELFKNV
jgi:large subunit ribosomal protein L23